MKAIVKKDNTVTLGATVLGRVEKGEVRTPVMSDGKDGLNYQVGVTVKKVWHSIDTKGQRVSHFTRADGVEWLVNRFNETEALAAIEETVTEPTLVLLDTPEPQPDICTECGGPLYTNPEGETGCVHCHTLGCEHCGNPDHTAPNCPEVTRIAEDQRQREEFSHRTSEGPVTIRYRVVDFRTSELLLKEKSFKTQKAMQKWVASQQTDNGQFLGVEAYEFQPEKAQEPLPAEDVLNIGACQTLYGQPEVIPAEQPPVKLPCSTPGCKGFVKTRKPRPEVLCFRCYVKKTTGEDLTIKNGVITTVQAEEPKAQEPTPKAPKATKKAKSNRKAESNRVIEGETKVTPTQAAILKAGLADDYLLTVLRLRRAIAHLRDSKDAEVLAAAVNESTYYADNATAEYAGQAGRHYLVLNNIARAGKALAKTVTALTGLACEFPTV